MTQTQSQREASTGTRSPSADHPFSLAVAAASNALGSAIHLLVAPEHVREYWVFGTFFISSAAFQAVAALLLARPSRRAFAVSAIVNAVILAVWALSRTVGVPIGPEAWEPEPVGPLDVIASVLEAAAVASSLRLWTGVAHRIGADATDRLSLSTDGASAPARPEWLTVGEAAFLVGAEQQEIRSLVASGLVPTMAVGRRDGRRITLVSARGIDSALEGGDVAPILAEATAETRVAPDERRGLLVNALGALTFLVVVAVTLVGGRAPSGSGDHPASELAEGAAMGSTDHAPAVASPTPSLHAGSHPSGSHASAPMDGHEADAPAPGATRAPGYTFWRGAPSPLITLDASIAVAAPAGAGCDALVEPGSQGRCGILRASNPDVAWVVERANAGSRFRIRVLTYLDVVGSWVPRIQQRDPGGLSLDDVRVRTADLTGDARPELVFGLHAPSTALSWVVVTASGREPNVAAFGNLPDGAVVTLQPGGLDEYIPLDVVDGSSARYAYRSLRWHGEHLRRGAARVIRASLVPTSDL